jgi:crotonobetainyl-CoA:carnitine CoA-transferase CaiB-like acyl-CoA transferase
MWKKLVGVMGKLEWATDARLLTDGNRVRNREMVDKAIKEWLKGKTTNEAVRMLLESGVASGPVQLLEQLPDDPQVRAREMFVEVGHPKLGKVRIPGSVLKMSETPGVVKTPGYPLGYNNYEVYHDMLGYSSDEIARLAKEKII